MSVKDNKIIRFLLEARVELKKVAWPTKQQVYKLTMIVIFVSIATAAFLGILDLVLDIGLKELI